MDVGQVIKARRSVLGITQQELADISGVGLRTIKQIETANGNPAIDTLDRILDVLGMELEVKIKRTVE